MNYIQKNRLERVKHVRAMLERYRADWQNQPAVVKAVFQLDSEIAFLTSAGNLSMQGTESFTVGKNMEFMELVHEVVWLSGILYSYADDHNDAALKDMCDVSPTYFIKMSHVKFIAAFQLMVEKAVALGTSALGEYGVDADVLESYQIMAMELDAILGTPKLEASDLKALRQQITFRLKKVRDILKRKIRNLLIKQKSANSTFWNAFEAAMVIVDRKAGHPPSVDEVVVG